MLQWWSCAVTRWPRSSTVHDRYAGDEEGKGGIYNFIAKMAICQGKRWNISWTRVELGGDNMDMPRCDSEGRRLREFCSKDLQQADTSTKECEPGGSSRSSLMQTHPYMKNNVTCCNLNYA
ncbi:Uncharacterized protein family (UPF0051) [Musa troglodytarum]|uniref:Uncharacterized protein family (UPF0051) n=1 Tax=Musa troglodytarum TaxID=320322 RepID=A0A9E7JRT6_9LILI|nr:Uncharacterized protein family (UPF0051) [Musa troglodytarum]